MTARTLATVLAEAIHNSSTVCLHTRRDDAEWAKPCGSDVALILAAIDPADREALEQALNGENQRLRAALEHFATTLESIEFRASILGLTCSQADSKRLGAAHTAARAALDAVTAAQPEMREDRG